MNNKFRLFSYLLLFGIIKFYLLIKVLELLHNNMLASVIEMIISIGLMAGLIILMKPIDWCKVNGWQLLLYVLSGLALYILVSNGLTIFKDKTLINEEHLKDAYKGVPLTIKLILTAILAPLFEELVFRTGLQNKIGGNSIIAVISVSIIFTLLHSAFTPYAFLTYFTMSVIFGLLYRKAGFAGSASLHIIINLMAG